MTIKKSKDAPDRLKNIESRLIHVEKLLHDVIASPVPGETWRLRLKEKRIAARETAVEPWRFLVRRQHPWRKQLYLKGRNLTARQLVGSIKANKFDQKKAAHNYDLPIAAIREALVYVERNAEFLAVEAEIERLMHRREGSARAPQPVP